VKRKAYFGPYEHHYILPRTHNGDLSVMGILHERMDVAVRLADDLAALSEKAEPNKT